MLRFMKNKIIIPLLLIGGLAAFFSFKYGDAQQGTTDKKVAVLQATMRALDEVHYSKRDINDTFSSRVYHKMVTELDPEKRFFSQKDIDVLSPYEFKLDDEINNSSIEFFKTLSALFVKRTGVVENYYKEILNKPFSFKDKEVLVLNEDKVNYAASEEKLKERWASFLKYRVLEKYVDLKDEQNKKKENKDTSLKKIKTDTELEADARESVRKNMVLYFKRLHKLKDDELFTAYMNCITENEDPHTNYYPPAEKKAFDEAISGTFYGIGAQLRQDGDKIKVMEIITGSPCWKQGELKAGDEITKVAQGTAEPLTAEGLEIEDVVKMIRGPKGTEVRLTVKHANGAVKVIPIIRDEVKREETFARSAIINTKEGKVGYIYLPEFYADFNHINGPRCAVDVKNEVIKLKSEGVIGMILDLRNNTGGSLSDVVDMAGLFIDQGPIVQVKSSDAAPMSLPDRDKTIYYDGPFAIMVNQSSASASEIMAAAMQDYKRAIIVGSPTYGKGTVQKIIPLDEFLDAKTRAGLMADNSKGGLLSNNSEDEQSIGSLKITIQKFYRVNGGSTQRKGVTPDILLPDAYDEIETGERENKAALPWDEIPAANYKPVNMVMNIPQLASMSKSRVDANPTFQLIKENAEKLKEKKDNNTVSLNETDYRKELEENKVLSKKMEELQKNAKLMDVTNPSADMAKVSADSSATKKNADWLKNLKKDIYISETVNIISDMNKSNVKVDMGTGMK